MTDVDELVRRVRNNDVFLTEIDFNAYSYLTKDVIANLTNALATNTTVTSLSIFGGNLLTAGGRAFANVLLTNSTMTSLSLKYSHIKSIGGQALANVLRINATLSTLDLPGNELRVRGGVALASALRTNDTVTALDVSNNDLDVSVFFNMLKSNTLKE